MWYSRYMRLSSIAPLRSSRRNLCPQRANKNVFDDHVALLCICVKARFVNEFVLKSPAMPILCYSCYSDSLWDGRQVTIQQLFCGVLLLGFVQNSMYAISFRSSQTIFSPSTFLKSSNKIVRTWLDLRNILVYSFPDRLYFQMVNNLSIAVYNFRMRMLT